MPASSVADLVPPQDAQLNALSVITHEQAFVNANDQASLLRLLSGMRNLRSPLVKSPLANPTIAAVTKSKSDREFSTSPAWASQSGCRAYPLDHVAIPRMSEHDGKVDASFTRDPQLDAQLARALRFAHRNYRSAPILAAPIAHTLPLALLARSKLAAQKRMLGRYPLIYAHTLHIADTERRAAARDASRKAVTAAVSNVSTDERSEDSVMAAPAAAPATQAGPTKPPPAFLLRQSTVRYTG